MTYPIHAVTVYCSSSSAIPSHYLDAARQVGRAIPENGWKLVYGGSYIGSMGVLADAARAAAGKVIGVIPRLFVDKGIADQSCDELIVADDMRTRKAIMEERADAFIALPGGLGTFDEVFEIIVGRQLHYHNKPIALLNIAGYFRPLVEMIQHGIAQQFIKPKARDLFFVAASVPAAIDYLRNYVPPEPTDKWFGRSVPSATE
jgi:uncharacterized protein (TIGR00730 family)